ncbi:MAG: hypothetical protein MR051_07770 [Lentisphaeria bacterium]|nr:hypothetical protein [Lentisphaeria bacterium]
MQKKYIGYGIALLLPAMLALWVLWPQESYRELKAQTAVAADPEAEKLIREFFAAAKARDRSKLGGMMLIRDNTDRDRYTEPFLGKNAEPVRFLGFRRLNHSSKINLTAVVYSQPLDKSFAFTLVKNPRDQYKVYSIGSSVRRP